MLFIWFSSQHFYFSGIKWQVLSITNQTITLMMSIQCHQSDQTCHPISVSKYPKLDDQLILRFEFCELKPNNYHLKFATIRTGYPAIVEILKGHLLKYALIATSHISLIYLQQFWNTITYIL